MRVDLRDFVATLPVTGTLVPRDEILVGPEVEGLRIVEVLADEGDKVKKGQILARLVNDTLDAQLAQNTAALAKSNAGISQAKSNIVAAEAKLVEARNAYDRGKTLRQSGYVSEAVQDQREAANRSAIAAVAAAKDAQGVAEADKAQVEAQRREISWKRGRTELASPSDGIVSRRIARVGGFAAGAADPLFRIISKGEIELDAEVTETHLPRVREAMPVLVELPGGATITGKVRIVSPEIDRTTRLGRIRVSLPETPDLRIGAFARGTLKTASSRGLAVPSAALQYTESGITSVQIVSRDRVERRVVKIGLADTGFTEIVEGVALGDLVIARAGTFLRDGDAVRPVLDATPEDD